MGMLKSRRLRWAGYFTRMGDRRRAQKLLLGRLERKRSPSRPKIKWEDNIILDMKELCYERDW